MRRLALAALAVLLLASSTVRAQPAPYPYPYPYAPPPPPPPRPFDRGSMNAGFAFGLGSGMGGTTIALDAHFGYFVLPGLEPGLDAGVTFGSGDYPTVGRLLPYVRWVIWRSWTISPYLKVQGGRWFVSDHPDVSPLGGGGGLVFFLSRMLAVQLEGMVYRLLPCGDFESCTVPTFGVSLGFFFGGRRPAPPPPPPSPPPQAAPAPAPPSPASPAPRHEAAPPQSRGVTDEPGVR
jgi:hypothetical protein